MEDTSNVCTFTFKQIQTVFRNNPEFDSHDLEFPNQLLLLPIQSHHAMVRSIIFKYFKTSSQPNCYAIGFAFFIYRTNKQFFLQCDDWSDFNTIEAHVIRHDGQIFGDDDRDKNDNIYCICGHPIVNIYITEYKNRFCMMGSDCIGKCKIKSMQEDFHTLTHYTCSSCNREYQQTNGKNKKTICGHCSKSVDKKQITYYDCYGCNNNYKVQYDDQHFCGRCDKKSYYDKERIYNEKSLKYCPKISSFLLHERRYPIVQRKVDTVIPTVVPIVESITTVPVVVPTVVPVIDTVPIVESITTVPIVEPITTVPVIDTVPVVESITTVPVIDTVPVVVPTVVPVVVPTVPTVGPMIRIVPRFKQIDNIIFCHGRNMFVEAFTCRCSI